MLNYENRGSPVLMTSTPYTYSELVRRGTYGPTSLRSSNRSEKENSVRKC